MCWGFYFAVAIGIATVISVEDIAFVYQGY
jgi:hypothetical protein